MKNAGKLVIGILLISFLAMMLGGCGSKEAAKDDYPNKPIKVIIPYAAGGNSDMNARKLAEIIEAEKLLPQPLVVVNMQGGGTVDGLNALKNADPDGYTIMLHHSAILCQANMGQIPYTYKDFDTVAEVLEQPSVIVAHKDNPWNNSQELLDAAKKDPGKISWTFSGLGATAHLASEIYWAGTQSRDLFKIVVYQGGADALTAQLGKHVDMRGSTTVDAIRYIKSGDLKAIAVSGEERLEALPDVPTFKELGLADTFTTRQGIFTTKGTPQERIDILADAFLKAVETPEYAEYLETCASQKANKGPKEFEEILAADDAVIANIVSSLDLKKQ
ncbi:Tripartite-type tricarboxylate transporter, receptor component TctC [Desulfotomaculum arcticum]|uniref:Tripartite-type tricarboxylate transporter, receptor component TctC n=1 Tax=Desulfotruncus arcticus DSM 17038 TaxID=1121424 RepID=A0A1I2WP44_9FIRM|nr:tripartite tricarboxylate transporter substrate binding protein [Desulfotruncus arcticus]SFH03103.1 Tripartite-type tricarboxylate transporter, receptor component TctC [Desulfotomaculum arcticum] [Desulfotruncus arcticus DSM 17038]